MRKLYLWVVDNSNYDDCSYYFVGSYKNLNQEERTNLLKEWEIKKGNIQKRLYEEKNIMSKIVMQKYWEFINSQLSLILKNQDLVEKIITKPKIDKRILFINTQTGSKDKRKERFDFWVQEEIKAYLSKKFVTKYGEYWFAYNQDTLDKLGIDNSKIKQLTEEKETLYNFYKDLFIVNIPYIEDNDGLVSNNKELELYIND